MLAVIILAGTMLLLLLVGLQLTDHGWKEMRAGRMLPSGLPETGVHLQPTTVHHTGSSPNKRLCAGGP